ncbi:MAG: DUF2335 domain-containing protein [Verrucomicrobiota bacterium]|nr:DUF2335 domain-containing protein [Verrucomicrobiota bacterium]
MSDNKPPESAQTSPLHVQPQKEPQPRTLEQIIQEKAPDVLKAIPGNKRQDLASIQIEEHRIEMRASPLPHPAELAAYDQIIPNGADRIMKMAENQAAHRIAIENKVISSQQSQAFFGQVCGLVIGLSGLAMATFAAVSGQPVFGGVIGGTTLVSLVGTFVYSRKTQQRELAQKKQQMETRSAPNIKKKKDRL